MLWAHFQDYFFLLLWKAGEFFSDVHPEHLGAPVSRLTEVGSLGKTCVCACSPVRLFVTPWTVPASLLRLWDVPGKNTGEGCHFLFQGAFLTQGSNLRLHHWQVDSLPLAPPGGQEVNTASRTWDYYF